METLQVQQSQSLSRPVLILNKTWMPHRIDTVRDAFSLLFGECENGEPKAKIIDPLDNFAIYSWEEWSELKPKEGEPVIHGIQKLFKIPEVLLLTQYDKVPKNRVKFSRRMIHRRDEFTCFTPDTLILMADGSLKPICEIKVGDKIVDGITSKCIEVEYVHQKEAKKGELISIRRRGNGDVLKCTKNHKIIPFDWKNEKIINVNGIASKHLSLSDYMGETILQLEDKKTKEFDLLDICSNLEYLKCEDDLVKHYSGNPVKRFIKANHDLGQLVGYYLSEGHVRKKNVTTFSFNASEMFYILQVQHLLNKIFSVKSTVNYEGNKAIVICCSSIVCEFFKKICDRTESKCLKNKTSYEKEFLWGVLICMLRGDATFNHKQKRCTLQLGQPSLVREMYLISLILGLNPTLSKTGKRKDGRIYKGINFNAWEFDKVCEFSNIVYSGHIKTHKSNKVDRKRIGNHLISKITEIKEIDYEGIVFDLQVGGSHTYIANFVCVHNCQYCGKTPGTENLTIDHVLPRAKGGQTTWLNCVVACHKCNCKKKDQTLKEAGMSLIRQPFKPKFELLKFRRPLPSWKTWISDFDHAVSEIYWENNSSQKEQKILKNVKIFWKNTNIMYKYYVGVKNDK